MVGLDVYIQLVRLHAQLLSGILDLGREILVTGVLKMALSHSVISPHATKNTLKEKYWELPATAAMEVTGSKHVQSTLMNME